VLIAGPTAGGKSAAALDLAAAAERSGRSAWIVNADSMQVYDALRILTARPGRAEERLAPHRLYGHVAAATRYSVGAWLADATAVFAEAEAAGALPIVVGGTGLYFKALSEGLRGCARIAVVADTPTPTAPCGACRQWIWEFAGDCEVVLANLEGEKARHRMSDLLPHPFDARMLGG